MVVLNEEEFKQKVEQSKDIVLVDFFATWCGPCKMLAPVLEEVEEECDAKIYKVDIDESEQLAKRYGIMVVPTMIIFVNGKEVEKFSGYMQKDDILEKINAYYQI